MVKSVLEKIVRLRNPQFAFDKAVSSRMIIELACEKTIALVRQFKVLFHFKMPGLVFFGKNVKLYNASRIKFGKFVKIGDYVYLSGLAKGKLEIGNNSGIGDFSRVIVSMSFNNVGEFIKIGDNCIVGQYLSCHPENHNYGDLDKLILEQGVTRSGIKIGENCWIGSKVTILDGVEIGDNCVIAAGAVVNKSMPSNSVIGGVPARVLKERT